MLLKQDGGKDRAGCPAAMLLSGNRRIRPASPSSELRVISLDEFRPHERAVGSPAVPGQARRQHGQKSCTQGTERLLVGAGLQRGRLSGEMNKDEAQATGTGVNAH